MRKMQTKATHINETREGFLRKNIVAVSFFQNCAIHVPIFLIHIFSHK